MRVRAHVLDRVVECREGNNQRVIWCVLGSLREIRRLQPCADGARRPQRLELLRERRCVQLGARLTRSLIFTTSCVVTPLASRSPFF